MALSKLQQLAHLAAGAIYNVARDFLQSHRYGFRGFWSYLQGRYGLSRPEAIRLAAEGRRGVQAAAGLGASGAADSTGSAGNAPYNPSAAPDYETPDRMHYHVRLVYRRGETGELQYRQINVFSDQPLTNNELLSTALVELQALQARTEGSPQFGQETDQIVTWDVDWVLAFRPLP